MNIYMASIHQMWAALPTMLRILKKLFFEIYFTKGISQYKYAKVLTFGILLIHFFAYFIQSDAPLLCSASFTFNVYGSNHAFHCSKIILVSNLLTNVILGSFPKGLIFNRLCLIQPTFNLHKSNIKVMKKESKPKIKDPEPRYFNIFFFTNNEKTILSYMKSDSRF
jgi:hypothetical protein